METNQYVIAMIGGAIAGVINTLAGNGSAITLTILTEVIGLPPNVANGTNRVGIFTQSVAGTYSFYKNGKLNLSRAWRFIIPTIIGAIIGVIVATNVSNEQFRQVFRFLMIAMLFVILVKPKRWLKETNEMADHSLLWVIPVYLALGFYGGFIQMGMGVFYLASMVLIAQFSIIEGNAVKVFVVAAYTIFVLAIFQYKGLIDWKVGAIMAIGQTTGGYLAAQYASKYPKANVWVYRVLVFVVVLAILKLFGIFELVLGI